MDDVVDDVNVYVVHSSDANYVYPDDDDSVPVSSEEWWWTEHLPELIWTAMWMFLFLVSLVSNLVSYLKCFLLSNLIHLICPLKMGT